MNDSLKSDKLKNNVVNKYMEIVIVFAKTKTKKNEKRKSE